MATDLQRPDALEPYEAPATLPEIEQAIADGIHLVGRMNAAAARRFGMLLVAAQEKMPRGAFYPWALAKYGWSKSTVKNLVGHARRCKREGRLLPYHPGPGKDRPTVGRLLPRQPSVEHYTALDCVEAARLTLGEIDLDPASNPEAQEVVKAARYFTKQQDGLKQSWRRPDGAPSRVFMNPPFGDLAGPFVWHLVGAFEAGEVSAAVVVLNGISFPSDWFMPLYGNPCCLTRQVKFRQPGGKKERQVLYLTAIVYLGPHRDRFVAEFARFGPIMDTMHYFDWSYHRAVLREAPVDEEE